MTVNELAQVKWDHSMNWTKEQWDFESHVNWSDQWWRPTGAAGGNSLRGQAGGHWFCFPPTPFPWPPTTITAHSFPLKHVKPTCSVRTWWDVCDRVTCGMHSPTTLFLRPTCDGFSWREVPPLQIQCWPETSSLAGPLNNYFCRIRNSSAFLKDFTRTYSTALTWVIFYH